MPDPSTKVLDHIVHLTPPGTVAETSQKFRELGFTYAALFILVDLHNLKAKEGLYQEEHMLTV